MGWPAQVGEVLRLAASRFDTFWKALNSQVFIGFLVVKRTRNANIVP